MSNDGEARVKQAFLLCYSENKRSSCKKWLRIIKKMRHKEIRKINWVEESGVESGERSEERGERKNMFIAQLLLRQRYYRKFLYFIITWLTGILKSLTVGAKNTSTSKMTWIVSYFLITNLITSTLADHDIATALALKSPVINKACEVPSKARPRWWSSWLVLPFHLFFFFFLFYFKTF